MLRLQDPKTLWKALNSHFLETYECETTKLLQSYIWFTSNIFAWISPDPPFPLLISCLFLNHFWSWMSLHQWRARSLWLPGQPSTTWDWLVSSLSGVPRLGYSGPSCPWFWPRNHRWCRMVDMHSNSALSDALAAYIVQDPVWPWTSYLQGPPFPLWAPQSLMLSKPTSRHPFSLSPVNELSAEIQALQDLLQSSRVCKRLFVRQCIVPNHDECLVSTEPLSFNSKRSLRNSFAWNFVLLNYFIIIKKGTIANTKS